MRKATLNGKYAAYPEYKDSGIEWLGNIPRHWIISSLRWRIKIASGEGISTTLVEKHSDYINTYPVIGGNGVMGYAKSHNTSNAIIIGRVGALCGNIHLINFDAWVSDNALKISSWESLYDKYFVNLLKTAKLNDLASKTAQPLLTGEQIKNLIVAIPPFNDQTQIAAFLDHETAKIDTLIEKQQQLIELLKEKRQAVISHAVTKGLNPDAPMKDSGVEWLGEVPEHWELPRLKQIIQSGSSISYGIVQPGDALDEGVPFIQTTNISQGTLAREDLPKTSALIEKNYPRSRLMGGEVILGIRASIGAAYVVPNELRGVNLSRGIARIQPNNQISSEFLVWLFKTNAVEQYWGLSKQGSTFSEVSIETVREMNVLVPPMQEQQLICKELNLISNKYDQLINAALAQNTLLRERRTALISAAVTGKIDVRNWVAPTTSSDTNEAQQEVTA